MLFVFDVLPNKAELIPAVRHTDGTARVQTVRRDQHERYYDVIKAFHCLTGVPVLINTSFNTRGEPMVCTPKDALARWLTTLWLGIALLRACSSPGSSFRRWCAGIMSARMARDIRTT